MSVEKSMRIFLKTVMGNIIPISWLFVGQAATGLEFDGAFFWAAYGFSSALAALGMWYVNREQPDPTYLTTMRIPTPLFGAFAFTLQPLVYVCVFTGYVLTNSGM